MNKDTAVAQANLNRIDQYTPQGSLTYQQTGTNDDGTPRYQQTQQYSPAEQAKYDNDNAVSLALGKLANDNISRVQQTQSQPFSFDGMTDLRTSVGNGLPFGIQAGPSGAYGTQTSIGDQGPVQSSISDPGAIQKSIGAGDLSADGQRIANSVYGQATSRLDPQWQQSESDMRSRLAAQGISENSDAYRRELDNMGRSKNDAYNQANYDAIQAGANEQSRIFGIQQAQGNFANTAQGQKYDQSMGQATLNNSAQDQKYQQALSMADLFNSGNAQKFSQDQSGAAFNNQARAQSYNEDTANANFQNNARQQQIGEASYLRNLPLNEIAALLGTGGAVNDPSFSQFAQVGVAAPDYQGIVSNNYNAAMGAYNQKQASRSSMLGSIFGGIGSIGGALAMSDRRVKHDIRRVGRLANGLNTYRFKYRGSNRVQFGVMAQEARRVLPAAVGRLSNGILVVDYSKVYA